LKKSHIIIPDHEFVDLTDEERDRAMELTIELWRRNDRTGEIRNLNAQLVRSQIRSPQNPLLLIYFLDPDGAGFPRGSEPIIGYAISFPSSRFAATVRYAVHEQLLPGFNIEDTIEESANDNED